MSSLRTIVAAAASGDTVDLRSLTCNRIILTSGAIAVPQTTLTVRGAGNKRITISGHWNSSIFRHSGTGTFVIGEARHPFAPGTCFFVPAGVAHRFEEFSADFSTWVVFWGPPGG